MIGHPPPRFDCLHALSLLHALCCLQRFNRYTRFLDHSDSCLHLCSLHHRTSSVIMRFSKLAVLAGFSAIALAQDLSTLPTCAVCVPASLD